MKFIPLKLVVILCMLLTTTETILAQQPDIIPLKDFFRNPEKVSFRISPDGKRLAFMQPWESRMNIFVQEIGKEELTQVTFAKDRSIQGYFWKNNSRLVFLQDKGGNENFHLYAVDLDGKNQKELTPGDDVLAQIIDDLEDNDKEMIIGLNKRNPQFFDAYRINIETGEMTMIAENPGNITGWVTDNKGNIRIATTTDGINAGVLYRSNDNEPFKELISTNFKESFSPLFFDYDDKVLFVSSNLGRDKSAIVKYDPETKKELGLVYEHPEVDVSSLLRSKKRKLITGVVYTTDKSHYQFFDKERKSLQDKLEARFPGYEVSIAGQNREEDKMLLYTGNDRNYGSYYFYDKTTGDIKKLADISPWLKESDLAEMKPIKYMARDGKVINGYLTLPKGIPAKNLPVIINPHGGPWARDEWGFNPEVQFLANRGYAVLQMNFRGSVGYGREFWEASFKQWGKTMQDDITDGVKWMTDKGIADPKRIAIYGASYGGYATLAGITLTPDLYACAVDYVGVSNLFTFMSTIPPYWKPYLDMMYEMVGDPEKDKELMTAASPVFHVDKIKCPLFIAQGANDPRVAKAESDQMVEALKKRGIDVPYMVKDNEGHGFANEENRMDFYKEMERFFGQYLGGRVEK
jgi:dipeptidyl aminopeptidase/acylaminoacyl peptidase